MIEYLVQLVRDKKRKPLLKIFLEFIYCTLLEKELAYHYFANLMYKKDINNLGDYLGRKKINGLNDTLFHPLEYAPLSDKWIFYERLRTHGLPTPHTQIFSKEGRVFDGKAYRDLDLDNLRALLHELIEEHSSLFIKPRSSFEGQNCFILDRSKLGDRAFIEEKLHKLLLEEDFLWQDLLEQHRDIAKIYSPSINTLRIHTYLDPATAGFSIPSLLMRFGTKGKAVDNLGQGGIFVGVDPDSWCLVGPAKEYFVKGGSYYDYHPDTGVYFNGTLLPYKEETYQLLERASRLFEKSFIGWDLALTPDGPVIIEANNNPHMTMAQVALGGLRSSSAYMEILENFSAL